MEAFEVIDDAPDPGLVLEITLFEVEGYSSLGYYITDWGGMSCPKENSEEFILDLTVNWEAIAHDRPWRSGGSCCTPPNLAEELELASWRDVPIECRIENFTQTQKPSLKFASFKEGFWVIIICPRLNMRF